MNLAILMSRLESPPQSCVVSVIWTCGDIITIFSALNFGMIQKTEIVAGSEAVNFHVKKSKVGETFIYS